jgi:hypothetical protein
MPCLYLGRAFFLSLFELILLNQLARKKGKSMVFNLETGKEGEWLILWVLVRRVRARIEVV